MRKKLAVFLTAVLLPLAWLTVGLGQSDMTVIKDPAFADSKRPPAVFRHDEHNDKAVISECSACHHGGSNGTIVPGETSEGTPCAECHKVAPGDGTTPLRQAYHQQCIRCHKQESRGPAACGECHPRQPGA